MTERASPADMTDASVVRIARALETGTASEQTQRRAGRMLRTLLAQLRTLEIEAEQTAPSCPIRTIQRATAEVCGCTVAELTGPRRTARLAGIRAIAIYLCRTMTQRTWPEIGRMFSRDHTTCILAYRRVVAMNDPETCDHIMQIADLIRAERRMERLPLADAA